MNSNTLQFIRTKMNKRIGKDSYKLVRVLRLTLQSISKTYDVDVMEDGTELFSINLHHVSREDFSRFPEARPLLLLYDTIRSDMIAFNHDDEKVEEKFIELKTGPAAFIE